MKSRTKTSRYTHGGQRTGAGRHWKHLGFLKVGQAFHVHIWREGTIVYEGKARLARVERIKGINLGVVMTIPDHEYTITLAENGIAKPEEVK